MCGRVKTFADRLRSLWCGRAIELNSEEKRDVEANRNQTAESEDTIAQGLRQAKAQPGVEQKSAESLLRVWADSGTSYDIVKVIGKGGFGEVYEAVVHKLGSQMQVQLPSRVAIKAEQETSLNMEIRVLNQMHGFVHFCTLFDHGRDPSSGHTYMVMTLLGPNLSFIRKLMPKQRLTLSSAVRCGVQMLHAIEELHLQGFVSRDVKSSNFAIGLPHEHRRLLYMLDFGIAQSYLDENGKPNPPEKNCAWRGTTRYCALANHRRQSPSPKDDVESWFYALVELIVGHLPWSHLDKGAKQKAYKLKVAARGRQRNSFIGSIPHELDEILTAIDRYTYHSKPEYGKFYVILIDVMDKRAISFADTYDWEHLFDEYMD